MMRTVLRTLLLVSLLALMPMAQASEASILKLHSSIAQTRPEAQQVEHFARLVDEKSDGNLKIEVYPSGSLGLKETDMMRIMQAGLVDMTFLYGEYFNRDAPALPATYAQAPLPKVASILRCCRPCATSIELPTQNGGSTARVA